MTRHSVCLTVFDNLRYKPISVIKYLAISKQNLSVKLLLDYLNIPTYLNDIYKKMAALEAR